MPADDFFEILRVLKAEGIDFILVGGLSAVLNGAPVQSYDVDVVHARDAVNVVRLTQALVPLDAVFRIQPHRRLKPNATHLSGSGRLNLITRYGPLDLLGTIGNNLSYEDLFPDSTEMDIGEGVRIRVLNLEKLIAIKEELGGDKDLAQLPILRRTLEEIQKGKQ
jgi:predicted nucleotidyltransferase